MATQQKPKESSRKLEWAKSVWIPLIGIVFGGLCTVGGMWIQSKKDDSKVQNTNSGSGNQSNTKITGNGTTLNPISSSPTINQANTGQGMQNNATNSGFGTQSNYFNPKITLTKFEKRALIDIDSRGIVEVQDTGKKKSFLFPMKNVGNVSALDFSLKCFIVKLSNHRFYFRDTIPMSARIDTIEQNIERSWHYDLLSTDLSDTLIFYIKIRYNDIKKHHYSPNPFIFLYPTNYVNKNLTFLDYDNSQILINSLKKYGG